MRAEAGLPYAGRSARAVPMALTLPGFQLLALLLLLPIFMQPFQYLLDVPPLWTFAKVSPLLLLPLSLLGLMRLRLPYVALTLALLAYVLLVAPVMSMISLENNLVEGIGSTVKVWSFSFYFCVALVLFRLRATDETLTRAFAALAVLNFAMLLLLWIVMPLESYGGQTGSIFLNDNERGPRIQLPMALGLMGMFLLARRFSARPALWPPVLMLIGLVLMLIIFKQRTIIAAVILISLWGMTAGWRRRTPTLFLGAALAMVPLMAMVAALWPVLAPSVGDGWLRGSLGGSLWVRENSAAMLTGFLAENPLRWIFGVGGSTAFSEINIQVILRTPDFFFADLGWLGVIGEYGLVGFALIVAFYLAAWRETWRAVRMKATPLRHALNDMVLFMLITSPILSMVYTPGIVATVLAIAVWLQRVTPPGRA